MNPPTPSMTWESLLHEAVARIIPQADPDRVILFGSHARGEARDDSDVDLLLIAPSATIRRHGRRQLLARIWSAMGHLPASFDFLLYSPEEVEQWRNRVNHVICRAMKEGRVLYERP
ncbi:MAG: nucleotidyltransferase domain-containing protein [Magnetococcales bacterium]|nr:nucleotidyltransferase domain-containing protein [Magnetococcales bacterium]MBF0262382.1 nucleotidyltransferase domain-containing protein [Magnetococcales bacterium]